MPIQIDYHAAARSRRPWTDRLMKALILYFVVSIVTLPFIDELWLGEVPLLALVQLPKTEPAHWLRRHVAMPMIKTLGLSRGSYSPDYGMAGPYALAATYLLLLGPILATACVHALRTGQRSIWPWVVVLAAAVDFSCLLFFGRGPGLTIY
jgi:hypothetical protein